MSGVPAELPDAELVRLVAALCDETLVESDRRKLEDRLREDPAALRYCAERVRFESELAETVSPPRKLEWSETRKLVRDGEAGWELRLEQSLRFGTRGHRARLSRWLDLWSRPWMKALVISAGIAVAAAGWWALTRKEAPALVAVPPASVVPPPAVVPLVLKNGDFEEPSLERSASPATKSILHWSDYFITDGLLVDVARMTNGKRMAHSGRNAVRLEPWDYITQKLTRSDGSPLVAKPGRGVRISGWAHVVSESEEVFLSAGLRYVDSPHPAMYQYEPVVKRVPIRAGGWRPFTIELRLPDNLLSDFVTKSDGVPYREKLDLTGKELNLSLDNRKDSGGILLLDDLKIEELDKVD